MSEETIEQIEAQATRGVRIIGLEVQNVMRIKAVEIRPGDDPVITISGKNAQGKTSLVESIFMGLRGARKIPKDVLRRGATKGLIDLALGKDGKVELRSKLDIRKGKTPRLTVFGAEGGKLKRPQEILDNLCGKQSLDARKFSAVSGAERIAIVQGLTGLDFTTHDAERSGVYEKRKDANTEVRRLTGAIESTTHHEGVPDAVVSVAKLTGELQVAMERNAANDRARAALDDARAASLRQEAKVNSLEAKVNSLKEQLVAAVAEYEAMVVAGTAQAAEVKALEDAPLDVLREQIATAEETNAKVRANAEHAKLGRELTEAAAAAEKLTMDLELMDEKKAKALAEAYCPVKGLTIGEDDVILNGCDFAQAGGAERLVVGAQIDLALHPDLDTVCLDECGNLDEESRAAIAELARVNKKQLLCIVAGEEEGSIIIEDGMVKGGVRGGNAM